MILVTPEESREIKLPNENPGISEMPGFFAVNAALYSRTLPNGKPSQLIR